MISYGPARAPAAKDIGFTDFDARTEPRARVFKRRFSVISRSGYNFGYTREVKTAVSMPDDLFLQAQAVARRLRMSRSQLFATAISEFLERQNTNAVTERLNEVYSRRPAKLNPALHRAQLKSAGKDSW